MQPGATVDDDPLMSQSSPATGVVAASVAARDRAFALGLRSMVAVESSRALTKRTKRLHIDSLAELVRAQRSVGLSAAADDARHVDAG